jgi:hypothetical protein
MSCYYCWQEGLTITNHGTCPYCSLDVCTAPSARHDGDFHGEICGCGCGVLVCELHLRDHVAREHGRDDPEGCFPALWALISGIGLGGSAAALLGMPGHRLDEVNRFVNMVAPRRALLDLVEGRGGWGGLNRAHGPEDEPAVWLSEEFYDRPRLERVFALAARELGRSRRGLHSRADRPGRLEGLTWLRRGSRREPGSGELLDSIWSLADFAEGADVPGASAIAPWLPLPAHFADVEYCRTVLAENRDVLSVQPGAVAGWILTGATETQGEAEGEVAGAW